MLENYWENMFDCWRWETTLGEKKQRKTDSDNIFDKTMFDNMF